MSKSDKPTTPVARSVLILVAALPLVALVAWATVGWLAAVAASGLYATALGLTISAERGAVRSRDHSTGLPDRAEALARLDGFQGQSMVASSQAAVLIVSIADVRDASGPIWGQARIFLVAARLAQGLRRTDQIMRASGDSLVVILGPSRGLTARAVENILARIEGMFRNPLRLGAQNVEVRVALGACLQHDAPRADAASWLEAAEIAAAVAAETGEPSLFPSGATEVSRSAWLLPTEAHLDAIEDWQAVADTTSGRREGNRRRRA